MKRYRVSGEMTISISTVVHAKTAAEAVEIAKQRGPMGLCHQCAQGEEANEWVTSGELDGEPKGIKARLELV